MNDSEKLDFLITLVTDLTSRLDDMEQKIMSLESAQGDLQTRNGGEFLDIREKLTALNDANLRNSRSLRSSVVELRNAVNVTRKETVNLVGHAIANESFEKGSEEKNVAVFNITNKQISPYRNPETPKSKNVISAPKKL